MKKRMIISILVGILAITIIQPQKISLPSAQEKQIGIGAWWGLLYPEYCFADRMTEKEETEEVHFSFWVAKALNWW